MSALPPIPQMFPRHVLEFMIGGPGAEALSQVGYGGRTGERAGSPAGEYVCGRRAGRDRVTMLCGRVLTLLPHPPITPCCAVPPSGLSPLKSSLPPHTQGDAEAQAGLATAHQGVTILFMDIVGFTSMSKEVPAAEVMRFLNELFTGFDRLVKVHRVHKVETAGDCYIVAGGVVNDDGNGFFSVAQGSSSPAENAKRVLEFAKDMLLHSRLVS